MTDSPSDDTSAAPPPSAPATFGPEGSAYDVANRRRSSRSLKRRIRGWLSWHMVGTVALIFPYLYAAYCWLVWKTSRVQDDLSGPIQGAIDRHGRVMSLMWHEEVFTAPWSYGPLHGHALVSTSNFGRIITRMLEVTGTIVYRGGSSSGGKRRRRVVPDMIQHMQSSEHCLYGITVDGSRGPAYEMKSGGLAIAKACRTPIYVVRTWYSFKIRLPTWDRAAIPLPFGKIYMGVVGPFWIDPDCSSKDYKATHKHLEAELLELAELSERSFEKPGALARPRAGFPKGWTPRWAPGQVGIPIGPHDLRPDDPPPWATLAQDPVPESYAKEAAAAAAEEAAEEAADAAKHATEQAAEASADGAATTAGGAAPAGTPEVPAAAAVEAESAPPIDS